MSESGRSGTTTLEILVRTVQGDAELGIMKAVAMIG